MLLALVTVMPVNIGTKVPETKFTSLYKCNIYSSPVNNFTAIIRISGLLNLFVLFILTIQNVFIKGGCSW